MAICISCGTYYRLSPYNSSNECDGCYELAPSVTYDAEYNADVEQIVNPSGKTRAYIYDDNDSDSFSS
jgi:hypothetical protein